MKTLSKLTNVQLDQGDIYYQNYCRAVDEIIAYAEELLKEARRILVAQPINATSVEAYGFKLNGLVKKTDARLFWENFKILSRMTPEYHEWKGSLANGILQRNQARQKFDAFRLNIGEVKTLLDTLHPPINRGTREQRQQLLALRMACTQYLQHLNMNYPARKAGSVNVIDDKITREQKYRIVEGWLALLNDKEVDVEARLVNFKTAFEDSKADVSKHRDPLWQRLIANIAIVLSGVGLLYTRYDRGTFNFFSSKGELFANKIAAILTPK